jgi:hypothetical protein
MVRRNARLIRSRSGKPTSSAITSKDKRPFQQQLRRFHAQMFDGFGRGLPRFSAESATELTWT